MKTFLIFFISAVLSIALQATLFSGVKPDIALVLVCFYSLKSGQAKGMAYGVLTGLIIDTINGYVLGPNIISKAAAGILAVSIRRQFFDWNLFLNTALIFLLSILDTLIVYISLEYLTTMSFAERSWGPSVLQVIYTSVVSIILYAVMSKSFLRTSVFSD